MSTWGSLLLDLAKSIAGLKDYLGKRDRENRERIASYFDHIASTLLDAAVAFEREEQPWDKYREIGVHLEGFFKVVGDAFPDSKTTMQLWRELYAAFWHDESLLGGTRARTVLGAITVRPLDVLIEESSWRDNPVRNMDDATVDSLISAEVDRIREVAGLFRGYAAHLRGLK